MNESFHFWGKLDFCLDLVKTIGHVQFDLDLEPA